MSDLVSIIFLKIVHVDSLHLNFILMMIIILVVEVHVSDIALVNCKASSILILPVHLHETKVDNLFSFLSFGCNIVTRRDLQNFIDTEIVVGEVIYLRCFLVELVK